MAKLRPLSRSAAGVNVYLEGPVGFPQDGGMSAAMFREQLSQAAGSPIVVHFNSEGGVVTDGIAMYNALRAYKARKVGIVEGIAASIASVVLMACDEIRVAKGAYVMIHNPHGGVKGGADDMRKAAETLESMRSELLDIYEARTGLERARLEKMLDSETYMTAEEALECGFAEKIEGFEARITLEAVARLDPAKVPAELRASAKGKKATMKAKDKAAKLKAMEEELAKLKAQEVEDPENAEDDDEEEEETQEDSEEGDGEEEEQASASAIVETVKTLTGAKSGAKALGLLVATFGKLSSGTAEARAEQVEAAIRVGKLAPALKKQALAWSDKTWSTYLASMGGKSALKLGAKHTPPKSPTRKPEEEAAETEGLDLDAVKHVAKLTGMKPEDIVKIPECAPQLRAKGGK